MNTKIKLIAQVIILFLLTSTLWHQHLRMNSTISIIDEYKLKTKSNSDIHWIKNENIRFSNDMWDGAQKNKIALHFQIALIVLIVLLEVRWRGRHKRFSEDIQGFQLKLSALCVFTFALFA